VYLKKLTEKNGESHQKKPCNIGSLADSPICPAVTIQRTKNVASDVNSYVLLINLKSYNIKTYVVLLLKA
jgi:hypothetical protein